MKTFEETKKYIVDFATEKQACNGQLNRAVNAKNKEDLLNVIKDNLSWVTNNLLFNGVNILEYFTKDELLKYNIGNIGIDNTGFSNSGDRNSGNWNSEHSNSGNWNSGAFCTDQNPVVYLFDKPTNILMKDWKNSNAYNLMRRLESSFWIESSMMTETEKKNYPRHEITGGYLKMISLKEAWANLWGNLDDNSKNVFLSLPNFDSDKFEEITGIKTKTT